ncbi:MAG: crotonobetainyl-CoA:carnitine CoA-transferase CaiB-like acyl-CoA transferase [Myxococcota bacterium]|jgi:crotonobetainyl-CoA:carnitine CoA-transferase CaiB-like acyl-CoA transferase
MTSPLQGVRVLDLSRVLSGPFASMSLADLGADVVKVEHPLRPDETRSFGPPFVDGVSAYYLSTNRGKRSITLDLKDPADNATARKLALSADIVLENFRPGVTARLGLGAEQLRAEKPELIYCSISGFGQDDPRPAYDLVIQGMGGIVSLIGPPDGAPYKVATSIADLVAGQSAISAILAAMLRRERTGEGASIDVPMLDGQRAMLVYRASNWLNAGVEPARTGNQHASLYPYATFAVADGYLNIAVANDSQFAGLCRVLSRPRLSDDPRFATNPARVGNRIALGAILEAALLERERDDWLTTMAEAGVPAGPILTVAEALDGATLVTHEHPEGGRPVRTVPLPFILSGAPRASERRAPRLGEHSDEVRAEWLGE